MIQTRHTQKLNAFMQFCHELAGLSACKRARVGAIIVPQDLTQVYSIGYNGPPARISNEACRVDQPGACGCAHAEANAIIKLNTTAVRGAMLICTHTPCEQCANAIINSGAIKYLLCETQYREATGMDKCRDVGIIVDFWSKYR